MFRASVKKCKNTGKLVFFHRRRQQKFNGLLKPKNRSRPHCRNSTTERVVDGNGRGIDIPRGRMRMANHFSGGIGERSLV